MKTHKDKNVNIIKPVVSKNQNRSIRDKPSFRDAYSEFFMYRDHPVPKGFLRKISSELIDYVENTEEIFRLEWFFTKKRILPDMVKRWRESDSDFNEVYQTCKFIMGMRREDKGLRKTFDSGIVAQTMPMYDDNYKSMMEWKSKLAKEAEGEGTKIVVIDRFKENKVDTVDKETNE